MSLSVPVRCEFVGRRAAFTNGSRIEALQIGDPARVQYRTVAYLEANIVQRIGNAIGDFGRRRRAVNPQDGVVFARAQDGPVDGRGQNRRFEVAAGDRCGESGIWTGDDGLFAVQDNFGNKPAQVPSSGLRAARKNPSSMPLPNEVMVPFPLAHPPRG